jgi:hypothetical protein
MFVIEGKLSARTNWRWAAICVPGASKGTILKVKVFHFMTISHLHAL